MVVPLLIAALAGAAAPAPGILFTSPRVADGAGLRIDHQQNWERRRPVLGGAVSASWDRGPGLSGSLLHRDLDAGGGREERFDLVGVEAGWWPWSTDHGAPAELGLAVMWTDSTFEIVRDHLADLRSVERTATVHLRALRRIGRFEPGIGLLWTNRFFKGRRERLDDVVACASLRVHAEPLPVSLLGEWCPWIANPDHRPAAWSASIMLGRSPTAPLTVFATNTYGSTLANVTGTIPGIIYGARVSVAWEFSRPPD